MSKTQVLSLYRSLIRESKKFPSYNFRLYALRKIRDSFRDNINAPANKLENLLQQGEHDLAIIKRQALIGQMYRANKLVIENIGKNTQSERA